jgi:hypothetical protein
LAGGVSGAFPDRFAGENGGLKQKLASVRLKDGGPDRALPAVKGTTGWRNDAQPGSGVHHPHLGNMPNYLSIILKANAFFHNKQCGVYSCNIGTDWQKPKNYCKNGMANSACVPL